MEDTRNTPQKTQGSRVYKGMISEREIRAWIPWIPWGHFLGYKKYFTILF
jgi:hypothetical protein